MRTHDKLPATKGDVFVCRGAGNAPGAGGIISITIVTDPKAEGSCPGPGGYECRDATPEEIKHASESGRIRPIYG